MEPGPACALALSAVSALQLHQHLAADSWKHSNGFKRERKERKPGSARSDSGAAVVECAPLCGVGVFEIGGSREQPPPPCNLIKVYVSTSSSQGSLGPTVEAAFEVQGLLHPVPTGLLEKTPFSWGSAPDLPIPPRAGESLSKFWVSSKLL